MKQIIYAGLVLTITLWSCGNQTEESKEVGTTKTEKTTKKIDFEALASDVCNCMQPVVAIMNKANTLVQEGKVEELKKLSEDSQGVMNTSDVCFRGLESIYGKIDDIKDEAFSVALQKTCPKVAALVSKAKQLSQQQAQQQTNKEK